MKNNRQGDGIGKMGPRVSSRVTDANGKEHVAALGTREGADDSVQGWTAPNKAASDKTSGKQRRRMLKFVLVGKLM